ncbi:hypothetical protein BH09ACT12_BH09ACT12_07840 [soil metagenome]
MITDLRSDGPEIAVAAVVATLGTLLALTSASYNAPFDTVAAIVVAFATAGIVAISRHRPGLALALVWLLAIVHYVLGVPASVVEIAFVVVAFATARWGRPLTAVLGALSIPVVVGAAAVMLALYGDFSLVPSDLYSTLIDLDDRFGTTGYLGSALFGMMLLGIPWLLGLALRFSDNAAVSQAGQELAESEAARALRESEQAREIARLRDEQARLARDVHDVVGHSLAVILAQAESAQYLADTDTEKLKATMATIATSARSSLQDVRHVLTTAAGDNPSSVTPRALDTLVEGVRASGHEVVSRELGTPQPMPPELEVVAYRVLQEMLTNAIKHGSRDEAVFVERLWPDGSWAGELRIEVRNTLAESRPPVTEETQPLHAQPPTDPPAAVDDGRGLDGMRRRLESCGGRLDVRRRDGDRPGEPATFTTTAWVPVRTVSP